MRSFKKILRKIVAVTVTLIVTVGATACFPDLGQYVDDEDYYDTFGSVSLTTETLSSSSYSVEDSFYNKEVIEDMKCDVPVDYYALFTVTFEEAVNIDEFALYVKGDGEPCALHIRAYAGDISLVSYNDYDANAEPGVNDAPEGVIGTAAVTVDANSWSSFSISSWIEDGSFVSSKRFEEGDKITLVFMENTVFGRALGYNKCAFCTTGLMVRAI